MTKKETKKQNLLKLIADIDKKMEKLDAQKKVYQLSLSHLEESSSSEESSSKTES